MLKTASEIGEEILTMCENALVCEEQIGEWKDNTFQDIIDMYLSHPHWCLKRKIPTTEYLASNFSKEDLVKNGIFVYCEFDNRVVYQNETFMYTCHGSLIVDDYKISKISVAGGSGLTLNINDNSICTIHLYDNAYINVTCMDNARCTIFLHSNDCTYLASKNVNIKDRRNVK